MNNFLKSCFGTFFALFMGVQGIVLQHISENPKNIEIHQQESIAVAQLFIGDYTKSLPIIYQGEKSFVSPLSYLFFPSLDYLASYQASLFHYQISVKKIINLTNQVDLIFDIRELLYPSHFFW